MNHQWYVVRTKPQAEYRAANGLQLAGIQVFFPCVQGRLRRGRTHFPLFPGYLLARCDLDQVWPIFPRISGVRGVLNFNGTVPSVPDEVISEISRRVEAYNQRSGLHPDIRPGSRVYVSIGSAESIANVVDESKPGKRIRVLMEFLGGLIHAEVSADKIRLADDHDFSGYKSSGLARRTRGRGRWIRGFPIRAGALQVST